MALTLNGPATSSDISGHLGPAQDFTGKTVWDAVGQKPPPAAPDLSGSASGGGSSIVPPVSLPASSGAGAPPQAPRPDATPSTFEPGAGAAQPHPLVGSAGLFTPSLAPAQAPPAPSAVAGPAGAGNPSVLFPGVKLGDLTPDQLNHGIGSISGEVGDALNQSLRRFLIRNSGQ